MGNFLGKSKKLVILRGLPGSGKTTLANNLTRNIGVVYSSDDFFMENGEYKFQAKKLKDSHIWNQKRTEEAMKRGEGLIVIDNTNVRKWEAKPYVKLGVKNGYDVIFREPETPWKFNLEELSRRDTHGVPEKVIERMLDQWENDFTVDNVLNSKAPWN